MAILYNKHMDCIFDKEKLCEVLLDFYRSTGISVTLYDASENVVATLPVCSRCCAYMRGDGRCVECCDRSNLDHMKEVARERKILRYTCHAGLMETILPIMYEDVLIAYLQIGQFRDAEEIYSTTDKIRATSRKYGFPEQELLQLYDDQPTVSEEKLSSLCKILEILIRSFWVDGLIYYNRSMLSIRIEHYIDEHLSENVSVADICERFLISKNALYDVFRDELGTTIGRLITEKRLSAACRLLKSEPSLNVTEIAARVGFTDYNYFIRLFKKEMGITPLKYRKSKPI